MVRLPKSVLNKSHRYITLKDITIVESCLYKEKLEDTGYTTEHELIYIISGTLILSTNGHTILLKAGEAALVQGGTYFRFEKSYSDATQKYESILFFIQKSYFRDFLPHYRPKGQSFERSELRSMVKILQSPMMDGFIQSLLPYFNQPILGKRKLLELKTMELLIQLMNTHSQVLNLFIQTSPSPKRNLIEVMETHFTKNLRIKEFAALSGRSASTFKRDFKKVFSETPARWLKKRRLQLARTLLNTTTQRPTDIYLQVGFEDYAHFSKAFKTEFGLSPSQSKTNLTDK